MKMLIVTEVEVARASSDKAIVRQWIHHYLSTALAELASDYLATTGTPLRASIVTSDFARCRAALNQGKSSSPTPLRRTRREET